MITSVEGRIALQVWKSLETHFLSIYVETFEKSIFSFNKQGRLTQQHKRLDEALKLLYPSIFVLPDKRKHFFLKSFSIRSRKTVFAIKLSGLEMCQ